MHKLLIKIHNKTGLRYLCYTRAEDHIRYPGSGSYWKLHLKKHGKDLTTILLHKTNDKIYLGNLAYYISNLLNVVNSDEWANLKNENCDIDGFSGIHSEETKIKISNASKNMIRTKDHYDKVSKSLTGVKRGPLSESHKQKLSAALSGRIVSEELRIKVGNYRRGKRHSPESIDKMRLAHSGKIFSEETKNKISKSSKGKPKSISHINHMSENNARANKGKIWITDGMSNKMIYSTEKIPENWHKGRKGNFLFQNGWTKC